MITFNANGTDARTLRALATFLNLAADEADGTKPTTAAGGGEGATTINAYAGAVMPYPPVPEEFKVGADPIYGTRADIGGPGMQAMERLRAARAGLPRNQFILDRGLTPIWGDAKYPEEAE